MPLVCLLLEPWLSPNNPDTERFYVNAPSRPSVRPSSQSLQDLLNRIDLDVSVVLEAVLANMPYGYFRGGVPEGDARVHFSNVGGKIAVIVDVRGEESSALDGCLLQLFDLDSDAVRQSSPFAGGRAVLLGLEPNDFAGCFLRVGATEA